MRNIFFYSNIDPVDYSSGITKKVLAQKKSLNELGFEVYYTGYTDKEVLILNNNNVIICSEKIDKSNKYLFKYYRRKALLNLSAKFIRESEVVFEMGYLRFHLFDKWYTDMLKELKRQKSKVIIEAHGYPYKTSKLTLMTPLYLLDYIYKFKAKKFVDLVAAISNYDNIWGCKTIQIDNAINLNDYRLKKSKQHNSINLITASNERSYHGYDKLIKGLKKYYDSGGVNEFNLYFIGEYTRKTKELVTEYKLEKRVKFLGSKSGEELTELFDLADIGIGALGLHAGSEYGSSIKTKEYFAMGLPFINGWKEYAFDDSYPYVRRFDVYDESIDFESVSDFFNEIKNISNVSESMRKFAAENYTWEKQFKKIFNAISRL